MEIINQNLLKFSTIKVKSYAKYFCNVKSIKDIKNAIKFQLSNKLGLVILGNGSNILFSKDKYDDILFMKLAGDFNFFKINNNSINIGAAFSLKLAGKKLIEQGYEDYLFFNLIPASIGGAVTQNAGIGSGQEIKDVCRSIKVYDVQDKCVKILSKKDCFFEYRNSIIKNVSNRYIVLEANFIKSNKTKDVNFLINKNKAMVKQKISREPVGYTFGSTFINGKTSAWEYVSVVKEKLKVNSHVFFSDKHNNWIVNIDASGEDIVKIIRETQKLVKQEFNYDLENEVKII